MTEISAFAVVAIVFTISNSNFGILPLETPILKGLMPG